MCVTHLPVKVAKLFQTNARAIVRHKIFARALIMLTPDHSKKMYTDVTAATKEKVCAGCLQRRRSSTARGTKIVKIEINTYMKGPLKATQVHTLCTHPIRSTRAIFKLLTFT